MTKLTFSYDFDKDVENFLRGTQAKNSSKPTKLQQAYIEKHGQTYSDEVVRNFIQSYIQESGFNAEETTSRVEDGWRSIEQEYLSRLENIFGIKYPAETIQVYITTNGRCTYRIEDGYFFVYANPGASNTPNQVIMHELLHFYTWEAFHKELKELGVSDEKYNDMKESLTELLNIEFADLMAGAHDDGYPQHAEIRQRIKMLWLSTKDIRRTVLGSLSPL